MSDLKGLISSIRNKGGNTRAYLTVTQPGTYKFRVLQNIHDENEAPFEEFILHRYYHPYYKQEANFRCINYKCPLCENAKKAGKDEEWRIKAKPVYIYNVIDRTDGKLKVLKVSWAAHDAIKAKLIEAAQDGVNLGHFKNGRDLELEVRKVGDKLKYKGYILTEAESKPVSAKILQEVKLVKPLEEMYKLNTREELTDIVKGKVPEFKPEKKKLTSKSSLIDNLNKSANINKEGKVPTPSIEREGKSDDSVMGAKLKDLDIFETNNDTGDSGNE